MLVALLGTVDRFTYVEDYSCYRIAVWYAMYASILVLLRWRSDNDGGQEHGKMNFHSAKTLYNYLKCPQLRKAKPSENNAYSSATYIQINFYTVNFPLRLFCSSQRRFPRNNKILKSIILFSEMTSFNHVRIYTE